jgi:hypothetical protein
MPYLGGGWSHAESPGTWTDGPLATLDAIPEWPIGWDQLGLVQTPKVLLLGTGEEALLFTGNWRISHAHHYFSLRDRFNGPRNHLRRGVGSFHFGR